VPDDLGMWSLFVIKHLHLIEQYIWLSLLLRTDIAKHHLRFNNQRNREILMCLFIE
jgi:hypothetical protein